MFESTPIIAFDQHAASLVAAVLFPEGGQPTLHQLASDLPTIRRFVKRVQRQGAVRCCYEAGPCGFELQRALEADGVSCDVIAPALIPRRPGDRTKTNRRDATQLAILYRAGALTRIHIPTEQEEAVRDLLRCREDIRADQLRARAIASRNSYCATGAASPGRRKRGPARTTRGCARRPGRSPRSRKHIRRICGQSTKPRPAARG
jgi:transposase